MNKINEKEHLVMSCGIVDPMDCYGVTLRSSNMSAGTLSFVMTDNFPSSLGSHIFLRDDVIKIRDYLNAYLERT
jgi:hypothetical protein